MALYKSIVIIIIIIIFYTLGIIIIIITKVDSNTYTNGRYRDNTDRQIISYLDFF